MSDRSEPDGGGSLLGVLVVLVILGVVAVLVVTALPDNLIRTSDQLSGLTPELNPGAGVGPGAAPGRAPSPAAGATTASCTANVRALQQAAGTKHAADGTYPATVTELVAAGYLAEAPALRGYDLKMEVVGGQPTGRVLVNGVPAEQGCTAPATGP